MATFVTVFLVAGWFRKRGYVTSPMCESFACSAHARELNIGNSKGTGPCEDFGEFVCTAWGEKHAQTQQTVAGVRIADWLKRLGPALAIVDPERPIATRAKSMLTACLTGTGGHAGSDNEALLEMLVFMSEVAFPWLTDASDVLLGAPDDYSKPLGTIVNLSVTWNMPLWFHVDLRLLHGWSFRHRSVSISPSFYCLWERVHANILKYQGFYGKVVRRYFEQVFSAKKIAPTFQTFVSNSATMQSDVLAKLKHILKATHPLPKLVEIRDLPRIVPQVDDHQWVDALQVAFKADPPLSASDTLFATNGDVLDSLRDIFWSYSARNVTMYTAWYFAQVMASVVSNRIRADISDHPEGATFIKLMCATQVMDVYNSLVASINGWGLHAELRPLVYKHLNNVHEVALQGCSQMDSAQLQVPGRHCFPFSVHGHRDMERRPLWHPRRAH
ncbi:hypothetical protein HPB48_026053 [Haemaphysalis longicornis]|uniref:Uncharacterized protein n=1 Tax=Haemaphysalis longicornis TaxID=44386 RepID=A0A9J6H8K4_HAELO|nr:hypothetical protein HPB48_026053 [Haemaphysalis longicornis]